MKKTFFKNLFREIKGSFSRFAAVFAISALGVGFLAGLLATTPDMQRSADIMYDNAGMMDMRVISTLGLTEGDVAALLQSEGVGSVQAAYSTDALITLSGGDTVVVRIHSMPQNGINVPTLISGRLPQNENECVVQTDGYAKVDIELGDKLIFSPDNKDGLSDTIMTGDMTIVGTVQTAYYFSFERESSQIGSGTVGIVAYTVPKRFTSDVYTEIYLTLKGAKEMNTFTSEYTRLAENAAERLKTLGTERSRIRTEEVRLDAQSELDEAKRELGEQKQKAEQELLDAKGKLLDAKAELDKARSDIDSGRLKLGDAKKQYDSGAAKYESGLIRANAGFAEAQSKLDASKLELESAKITYAASKAQVDEQYRLFLSSIPEGIPPESVPVPEELAAALAQVEQGGSELEAGEKQYNDGMAQLAAQKQTAYSELAASKLKLEGAIKTIKTETKKLENGEQEYKSGLESYEQGMLDYQQGEKEANEKILDAEDRIYDAQKEIDKIEDAKWYVLDRNTNPGFVSYEGNSEKVGAIAKVFPIFFFLVAALVIITTMTRMVDEQRMQIGTMKALGYSSRVIQAKYLVYAGLACAGGCAAGILIGFKLFPTVIYNAYGMMYTLPQLHTPIIPDIAIFASIAAIGCGVGSTWLACNKELLQRPAVLMRPKAPPIGRRILLERITPIWKRMKFTQKVTARNLFRYKKRLLMTIIGVAGSTALLLAGFGLRDSIGDIIDVQFGEINKYNLMLEMKDERALTRKKGVENIIDERNIVQSYMIHAQERGKLLQGEKSKDVNIYVPQTLEQFPEYVNLRERRSGKPISLTESGAVISEKLASTYDISVGDTVTLQNADEKQGEITVTGICENYVDSYIYITHGGYERAFGTAAEYKMVAGKTGETTQEERDDITAQLLELSDVSSVNFTDTLKGSFGDMLKNIDYIIIVIIFSAGALAFIVLYNLININITERQRELATIKVLGFYDREVSGYIYRETVINTLLGVICGLLLGIWLHRFVIITAEVDMVMFGRTIYPLSYLYAAGTTLVFAALVNIVMSRKMKKIDMVESLKANE